MAANRIGNLGQIIAVEAHPETFELLRKNMALNGLDNVMTINSGVSSQKGKAKLYLDGDDSGFTVYDTIMVNRTKISNVQSQSLFFLR